MTTKTRREDLMIYLADADDKKVNALYTLLEEDIKETSFLLTDEYLSILEQRRSAHLSGESTPVQWKEAHARIVNKRKSA